MTRQPAEPFNCHVCGRRIGKTTTHCLVLRDPYPVICVRCHMGGKARSSRWVHALLFDDCPVGWHDMYDHTTLSGTRAGIRWALEKGEHLRLEDRGYGT